MNNIHGRGRDVDVGEDVAVDLDTDMDISSFHEIRKISNSTELAQRVKKIQRSRHCKIAMIPSPKQKG
jgi:hypothetical protein